MGVKLKPCPFCGNTKVTEYGGPEDIGYVVCECGASVNGYHEPPAQSWNNRAIQRNGGPSSNYASPKLVEDLESARDWLLRGKRKVNSADIKFCLEELNNIINQLQA